MQMTHPQMRNRRSFALFVAKRMVAVVGIIAVMTAAPLWSHASTIEIQLGGVDIRYDGANIFDYDPGSSDPDPLTTVTFLVDNVMVGSVLTSDITLEMFIPNVLNIDDTGDTVVSGSGGVFNLGLPAADFLSLELDEATITYADISGIVQFAFGGSIAGLVSQSLPFGLTIEEPISVSFSTQINAGSLVTSGGTVDQFTASGTGEIVGVPEPSTVILAALGVLGLGFFCWRKPTRA